MEPSVDKKNLSEQLVKLDINVLLDCLKEKPKTEVKFKKYVDKVVNNRRQSSSIIAMRDLHNWIKTTLITNISKFVRFKNKKVYILDIAVGRGGDLGKWNKAGIDGVFGFDINTDSIYSKDPFNPGAIERLVNFKGIKTKIEFSVGNATLPSMELVSKINNFLTLNKTPGFQMVSCQFALHYFFKDRESLNMVFIFISKYLQKDGYFFGTCIDSSKIRSLFASRKFKEFDSRLFNIKIKDFFKSSPYSNEYYFAIKDTFDRGNYFNTTGVSTEYLIDFQELTTVAANYGLVPVNKNLLQSFTNIYDKLDYADYPTNYVPFEHIYNISAQNDSMWVPKKGTRPITQDEIALNSLYTTFVFKKIN